MKITKKMKQVFGEDKDTQPTNAEIEEKIEEEDVVGLYVPLHISELDAKPGLKMNGVTLPVSQLSVEQFTSIEEMTDHIRKKGAEYKKKYYFFDREDKEVRDAVMNAFKENKCEKLREKKKKLEGVEKELEELNCETFD